jgi:hypothetical protein
MTTRRHFYATTEDLLPVIEQVESKLSVAYVEAGLFESAAIAAFRGGVELPTLHKRAPTESAISGYRYLVTFSDVTPQIREVHQRNGGSRYAVDQLANPDSVIFQHGGFWNPGVLLYGCVSTVSNSSNSLRLHRAFSSAIAEHFTRIKSFYVGDKARSAMLSGCRLTIAASSPSEYDLAL